MKCSNRNRPSGTRLAAIAAASLLLAGVHQTVFAVGTVSGTDITNLAKLSYKIGGVDQGDICSSEAGNSTSNVGTGGSSTCVSGTNGALNTTFKVDNKVNLALTEVSTTFSSVSPGAQDQVTTFALTNLGNTAQGFNLTAANVTATVFTLADGFDVTGIQIYLDANNNGLLDPAEVTAGAITSLASVAADATVNLLVVADIPVGQANGTQAAVSLTAVARTATTLAALTETANTQGGVEIVFADPATAANVSGTDPGQTARDATAVARDAYRVSAAIISIAKTATLICDPFNGTTSPKNIPGAIVRWTITVSNAAGGASATLATVSDALNANTTHDANLVLGTGAPAATTCNSATGTPESLAGRGFQIESSAGGRALGGAGATGYMTNAGSLGADDGASISAGLVTIDYAVALPAGGTYSAGEIKPGESATVTFNVTIN